MQFRTCVKDALTGVVYGDDSQVCIVTCAKKYSDKPGVTISVKLAGA